MILMSMRRAEDQLNHLARTLSIKGGRRHVLDAYHAAQKLKRRNYLVIDLREEIEDDRLQLYCGLLPDEPRIYFCPD